MDVDRLTNEDPVGREDLLRPPQGQTYLSDSTNISYGDILKRRWSENIDAFRGLGVNEYQMIMGGNPEGRMKSATDFLKGLGSVSSSILTPVSGAVEKLGLALGGDPEIARDIGDISELPAAWLFGGLASAGKLGMPALKLVQKFGAGRPMSLAAQRLHDVHLDYAAGQAGMTAAEKQAIGMSPIEELSRMSNQSIGDLAIAAKKPSIASIRLKQLQSEGEVWDAKVANGDYSAAHEIPESPTYVYTPRDAKGRFVKGPKIAKPGDKPPTAEAPVQAEFTPEGRDPKFIIGTTAHAAQSSSPYAVEAAYQLQLNELRLIEAKKVHHERTIAGLSGYGDETTRAAVTYRNDRTKQTHITRNVAAETTIDEPTKEVVKWMDDKISIMDAVWIPRLRASIRPKIERQVRAEVARGSKAWEQGWIKDKEKFIAKEVNHRVMQEVPNDWTIEDHLGELLHGEYKLTSRQGITWEARTPQGLRQVIREIKELHPEIELSDLKLTGKRVFLDDDLIRELGGGRTQKVVDNLLGDVRTHTNLDDMWNGVRTKGRTNFFRGLLEGKNQGPGYSVDLMKTFDILDGQTERLLMLSDVERKVGPMIEELSSRGLKTMAHSLERAYDSLKGVRSDIGISFDRYIASNPLTSKYIGEYALERWAGSLKSAIVTGFLKVSPRYQGQNSVQLLQTLYPIVDTKDMARGASLIASKEGREVLQRHGVFGIQNKIEGQTLFGSAKAGKVREWYDKITNASEKFNQEKAFLVMYDKARRLGLNDLQAGMYGKLRGQVYSQFLGLVTDTPDLFRRMDPFGVLTMFQRYPVKQFEMLMDIVKDKNFPAAAKWLAVNFLMGGARSTAMGNAGWLTHKMYDDIKKRYGESVAAFIHSGLPGLVGIDMASSVMFLNPPFGDNWFEKIGRLTTGVIGSVTGSVIGAAMDARQPEPYAAMRAFNSLVQQIPAAKQLNAVVKLMYGDYDLRTPGGKLKYRADAKDLFKIMLGAKPLREATQDTAITALMEVKARRDHLIDFIAARRGQAEASGIGLGQGMEQELQKLLDGWNGMWPEFPIVAPEIRRRGEAIKESANEDTRMRMMKRQPKALQRHPSWQDFRLERIPGGDEGGGE
jgi:hypothetical protein